MSVLSPPARGISPRHLMTDKELISEWVRHYRVCHLKMNALCAILENDGPKMLGLVLRELKLEQSENLVKAISNERSRS